MSNRGLLTVVIPAYNEEKRLGPTLERIIEFFQRRGRPYEILVVDDGSTDATCEVVSHYASRDARVRCMPQGKNLGKGAAVRKGMLHAVGDWVLMTDADLSTPIEELEQLELLGNRAEVVIASRRLPGSRVEVREPALRERLSLGFNYVVRWALLPGIPDTQCGFKLWSRAAAREVFLRVSIRRCLFEVESLWLARQMRFRIAQVPIRWRHDARTSVRIRRDAPRIIRDFFRILLRRTIKFKV